MEKIEPIVKTWYDYLDEGKIMGMKCKNCGSFEFPPLPICKDCGHSEMEWTQIEGTGTLMTCAVDAMPRMYVEEYGPLVTGYVQLKEGPSFITWIVGLSEEEKANLFDMLPVEVEAEIQDRGEYRYPVFHLKK